MTDSIKKIGLMCGTFDPPHIGHLILAQTALAELGLDQVLFLPVGDPTHKSTGTPADHRINMTALAIAGNKSFALDTTDATRKAPHYTSSLLPLLAQAFPNSTLWLLIGGDSLSTFPTWHHPAEILQFCRLAVLNRPGYKPDLNHIDHEVPGVSDKIDWLHGPTIHLSSSWLRQEISKQNSMRYFLPAEVEAYARTHQLYG